MKKIFGFMMLALMCVVTMSAEEKTTINRMVLKAAQEFNAVVVSGDVTVEMRFNPEKAGYIVYHYDKRADKKIRCFNDGNVLHVQGSADAVMTRIVVFYGQPLEQIINNGDARLVSLRVRSNRDAFGIVVNGKGDVRLGRVKSKNVDVVTNGAGNVEIRKVAAETLNAVVNGSGNIVLGQNPDNLNIVRNGSGNVEALNK